MKIKKFNFSWVGVIILIGAFGVSLWRTWSIRETNYSSDKKIIRIVHWQLELGYRDALQSLIDEYEKVHPDVKVIQLPISEKVYPQWLNTQLVGNTAPEIIEMGQSTMISNDTYVSRYFLPLTDSSQEPNPYNKGTNIAELPWRETFADGMRGGYRETLQDYYGAPTSMFTIRMFYNKELLKKATGSSEAPKTLGELLDICEKIKAYGEKTKNINMIPIAGSKYILNDLTRRYMVAFTASYEDKVDYDINGTVTAYETYAGFVGKDYDFNSPKVKGCFECLKKISSYFPTGFVSVGREMAAYMFVQGNAGFISTGSWDAASLFRQAKFDVGIIDFPLPAKDEKWGDLVVGRLNEAGVSGGAIYGLYKYSANKDIALDFLRFLTSQKYNQFYNRKAEWIPVILGASTSERMKVFTPNPNGYVSFLNFEFGNYCKTIFMGQYERFLSGEIGYEEFAGKVADAMLLPVGGEASWALEYDKNRRKYHAQEGVLAVQLIRRLFTDDKIDARQKYRSAIWQQVQANNANTLKNRYKDVSGKELPDL